MDGVSKNIEVNNKGYFALDPLIDRAGTGTRNRLRNFGNEGRYYPKTRWLTERAQGLGMD